VEVRILLSLQYVLRARNRVAFRTAFDAVELIYPGETLGRHGHQPSVGYDREEIQEQPDTNDQKAGTRKIDDSEEDQDDVRKLKYQALWYIVESQRREYSNRLHRQSKKRQHSRSYMHPREMQAQFAFHGLLAISDRTPETSGLYVCFVRAMPRLRHEAGDCRSHNRANDEK